MDEILDTMIFTNLGPFATKLEAKVCSYLEVKHAFAVSNATVGLAMMLRASNLRAGGEVILPAYTFIATAHAVLECNLKPVFCDCDPESHLIGIKEVSACISDKTVAILAVNLWGLACDVEGLQSFAKKKQVALLFDSAHSFGARASNGKFVGNFGDAEVFSMHATKLFNSFEGGLITTNDDSLALKLAPMRNFGITGQDEVSCWGSNYKLSEVHAAFALRQLENIGKLIETYTGNAKLYSKILEEKSVSGLQSWNKRYLDHEGCTHSYLCLEVEPSFPLTRDQVIFRLREKNIFAKRYFFPGLHKCQPYLKTSENLILPVTDRLCQEVLVLPTGSNVGEIDILRVVDALKELSEWQSSDEQQLGPDGSAVLVDYSHIQEKITYVKGLKSNYEELAGACDKDLLFLEDRLSCLTSDRNP